MEGVDDQQFIVNRAQGGGNTRSKMVGQEEARWGRGVVVRSG